MDIFSSLLTAFAVVHHDDWSLSERGKKDAERHQKKIDDAIRKNVKDVIAEESIITDRKGKKVRVPVKGLKDYRFVHGKNSKKSGDGEGEGEGNGGAGQGPGKPGDVIGRRPKDGDGQGKGKAGNEPGEDYIEAEVDIDYLIQIMFEDLGLPWIEDKTTAHQLVPSGWKFDTISKVGILPRIHKKRTMMEAIKRNELFAAEIREVTGCNHDDALIALAQASGDINLAIKVIATAELDRSIDPYILIEDEDMRYKQIEQDYEIHSNAVVLAMMDVSGSMDTDKKYLCRSLLFWLVEFLKKVYNQVQIRFIVHTTDARVVDEETFFHKGESGGTYCWTAIEKALYLIDTEYPVEDWNVYAIYVSDGEDFDVKKTLDYIKELLNRNINMFSYNEIDIADDDRPAWADEGATLLSDIKDTWEFVEEKESGTSFYKNEHLRFLASLLRDKTHIYPCLKHILFTKRK